jgi:hypothetical protein
LDLAGIKVAIIKAAPGFGDVWVRCFDWQQHGDIITAKPRYPMSDMCFNTVKKVFRKLGGHYVSGKDRTHYFELVLKEAEQNETSAISFHSPESVGAKRQFSPVSETTFSYGGGVFKRFENQLSNLKAAAERELYCTEKAQALKQILKE